MIARLSLAGSCLAVLVLALVVPVAEPAWSQPEDDPAPTVEPGAGEQDGPQDQPERQDPDIIREPGAGEDPEDAGDRGGALQVLLFMAIIGGVLLIVTMVVRESRRNRSRV